MPQQRGPLGTRAAADCGLEPRRHVRPGPHAHGQQKSLPKAPRSPETLMAPAGRSVLHRGTCVGKDRFLRSRLRCWEVAAQCVCLLGARAAPRDVLAAGSAHVSSPAAPAPGALPVAPQRSEVFGACHPQPAPAS